MTGLQIANSEAAPLAAVPRLGIDEFRTAVLASIGGGGRIAALLAHPLGGKRIGLLAVVARAASGTLGLLGTDIADAYPALTPDCPQAHAFERAIAEEWGVRPEGHPWLKPLRFAPARGHGAAPPGVGDFFAVRGDEVHEVAVGPVHAGVIEPGHFRFQCHGERVLHLEIALGYQHRGVERALVGGPGKRSVHHIETLAGDTSVGHATAYCQALEALAGIEAPARAQALRAIALELERLANHTGDLGALAGDVGYLPTAAFCGRLRGDFLGLTALVCGSRLGRGLVRPGGTAFDVDAPRVADLAGRLERAVADLAPAVELLWGTPSVQARFEETGRLSRDVADALGVVGPVARASGLERDVRQEFPAGLFRFAHIPLSTWRSGDVFARAYVRWLEIQRSAAFLQDELAALPAGPVRMPLGGLAPEHVAVTLVEGWRGEICHVAITDVAGRFARYGVVDPSVHNWMGLALALRGQQISDFPLCNKSFNLSYCGHDL